jgi:colicin import membrane protein
MNAARPSRIAPIAWAIALHVALAGLLFVGLSMPRKEPPQSPMPIEAVVVDEAVLRAATNRRTGDDQRRAEQAAELRRQQEAAALEQRQEEARLATLAAERAAEKQRQLESERAAKQKAEAEEVAEARRKAEAEEAAEVRRRAEAQAKREAEQQAQAKAAAQRKKVAEEARLRAERESELRARLAAEEQRTSAAFQGLKSQYVAAIQAHVERRWFKPPGIRAGASCTAHVTQIPGGEVIGVRFGTCNGGEALRQSIETAVRNASPLPPPPEPSLFEREVRLVFTPEE